MPSKREFRKGSKLKMSLEVSDPDYVRVILYRKSGEMSESYWILDSQIPKFEAMALQNGWSEKSKL